jgi:hypothetical protein
MEDGLVTSNGFESMNNSPVWSAIFFRMVFQNSDEQCRCVLRSECLEASRQQSVEFSRVADLRIESFKFSGDFWVHISGERRVLLRLTGGEGGTRG